MKAARFLVMGAMLAAAGAWTAFAQEKVGEAVYMEGGVSLERNGAELDPSQVQTGIAIDNFDLVKTGADGLAEVSVKNPKIPALTIKVSPRTQFSFELNNLGSRQQTSVGLMSGSISLKAAKLSGSQDLNVVLDNAVMGVRGTEFTVTAVPSGDMLVTCRSGDVVLTDENGAEIHAVPGTAVQRRFGAKFAALSVGSADPDDFRKDWEGKRIGELKTGALAVIQREAQNYDRLVDQFTADYAALQEKRQILDTWEAEEKSGGAAGPNVEKEKAEIADLLADIRETQFLLARAHFRLAALKEYHDQGFGEGQIRNGLSAKQFFERFEKDRRELEHQMAGVRLITKLYVHRNGGRDPTVVVDLHKFNERRIAHLKRLQHKRVAGKGKETQQR